MNRVEQLQAEMDPNVNSLIPNGRAAQVAADNELNSAKGAEADRRRSMSGFYNRLIPGSPRQQER
jgi:hypothetical protein